MNTKEQGAIGVAKAVAYFGSQGHAVFIPVSDFKRYDLIIDLFGELKRVEVKTTTQLSGQLGLRTLGGNQSWSGEVKRISEEDCDLVFCVNLNTGTERLFTSKDLAGKTSVKVL
jgi:hypothetical protein